MADPVLDPVIGLLGSASALGTSNFLNMITFTVGLVLYAVFVWHFHRFIGKRDVFSWDTDKFERSGGLGKLAHGFAYFVKYLIAYPIMVFVWFGVFSLFLFVLGNNIDVPRALLVSFAMVTGIGYARTTRRSWRRSSPSCSRSRCSPRTSSSHRRST